MSPLRNKSNNKSTIFIVDDHPVLRKGLSQLINHETDMITIGEASNSQETMSQLAIKLPSLCIIDISLEGISGIELTRNLVAKYPDILILIISMYDESIYVERVLRAGAKGYLTKREANDHIVRAVRTVLSGEIYVSQKWKDRLLHKFVGRARPQDPSYTIDLSDRELEVLQLTGQGLATKNIAQHLHVSIKTIESHYANIKTKLDLNNSHELIQYAVKWCLSVK